MMSFPSKRMSNEFAIDALLVDQRELPVSGKQGCYSDGKVNFVSEPDSGDGIVRTFDQCKEWANWLDCDIRLPADNELFVDIDSEDAWKQFEHVWPVMKKHYAMRYKSTPSRSGLPKRHVVITLASDKHTLLEKIAMQAALGSDGRRETISIVRALAREDNVVVFFEPKVKV